MNRIELIELSVLYLPIALAVFCWHYFKPVVRTRGALLLSFLWSFIAIFAVNQVAFYFDWWDYADVGISYKRLPLSVWLGWSISWGIVVPLLPIRGSALLLLALVADVLLMPLLKPLLILKTGWILGELLALAVIIIPAVLVYKWTLLQRSINKRVTIQAIIFFSLVGYFLPDFLLNSFSGLSFSLPEVSPLVRGIQLNLLFFWIVIGISAVREFIQQGKGTPIPYDPPLKMVESGLYAYISNPMQLSTVGALFAYAWLLDFWGLLGAGIMVIVYSLGIALPSENKDLTDRFGERWLVYRRGLKPFLPVWNPHLNPSVAPAKIYFEKRCQTCNFLGCWLKSKQPKGLDFEDAEAYCGGALERLTYIQNGVCYEGVRAFARGLNHVNLGWAIIGCFIQFPGISHMLQMIADADMFGRTHRKQTTSELAVKPR